MPANRVFLVCLATTALSACIQSNDPIVIGLAGPFSQPIGRSMRSGAELAVSEIGVRAGVRGRRIELRALDDRGQVATAVQTARRFLEDKSVVAVIGHAHSNTTIAAAPVYDSGADPVALVSPSASSVDLDTDVPRVFRICPDDVAHAQALAEWARAELDISRAATLYHNDRDSRTFAAAFYGALTALGGTVIAEDPFSQALPSFEPYISRATRSYRLDALLIAGGESSIGPVLAALDSVGSNTTILGRVELLRHAQAAGRDLEGAVLSASYLPDRGGPANDAFVTAFLRTHGGQKPDHVAAAAYDVVHLVARAIENAGASRAAVISYISRVGSLTPPFEGATGTIAFDEHGNLQRTSVEIGVVRNGVVVPTTER